MKLRELENHFPSNYFYNTKDQLQRHIYKRSEEAFLKGKKDREEIKTVNQHEKRKEYMKNEFVKAFGGHFDFNTPLNAKVCGRVEGEFFDIENIIFESRPEVYVTANLYIPHGLKNKTPAVIKVCGHHYNAKHEDEYQRVARMIARCGIIVLSIDPIGQGERAQYYEKSAGFEIIERNVYEHDYEGAQCLINGNCLSKYFTHDIMRAVDYLCLREEVDSDKIGIVGNSGGGVQVSDAMMCDDRIKVAAIGTYIMNRQTYLYSGQAQDAEQIWLGMSEKGFDHEDFLLCFAPKPLLILSVAYDFFPIEGTRETYNNSLKYWQMYDKADDVELFVENIDHYFSYNMAKKAAEFFAWHLLNKKVDIDYAEKAIEHKKLLCTKKGSIMAEFDDAKTVFDNNLEIFYELKKNRPSKDKAIEFIKNAVFKNRDEVPVNPRILLKGNVNELCFQTVMWFSQKDICNYGIIFRDFRFKENLKTLVCLWDRGTLALRENFSFIREKCRQGYNVFVVDLCGMGSNEPNSLNGWADKYEFYGVNAKLSADLFFLGDSICAMRAYELTRIKELIGALKLCDENDISYYAKGRVSVYLSLAKVCCDIDNVEIKDGFESYESIVTDKYYDPYDIYTLILPHITKYTDINELE